ncbi:RIP metalloprotease RseP [Cetobacterium ceti]
MSILIALLVLGVIIMIHELGHFVAARICKMPISEFAIGMGPEIYSYYTGKTLYSIRAIPIGGFVNIDGMEVESKVRNGFNSKPAYERFFVLFAGVFMNFILAFTIIFGSLMINGKAVQSTKPVVGETLQEAKAYKYLKPGDKIEKLNDISIEKWDDIGKALKGNKSKEIPVVIERKGEEMTLDVPLTLVPQREERILGIIPEFTVEKYGLVDGITTSFKTFGNVFVDTVKGLKMLVTGKVKADEISGPVGIVKIVGQASRGGGLVLLWLTAILSINVGIFNLLPFPALDGGRILFVILEMVGIKVNKKLEEKVHMAGMFILFALIIFATANDVFNLTK